MLAVKDAVKIIFVGTCHKQDLKTCNISSI